jgi:hybrid cluster-associated redox disulfide protein
MEKTLKMQKKKNLENRMERKNKMNKKKSKKEITKDIALGEIVQKHPEAVEILFSSGLHCIGCGMAMYETLEQGCRAHGMSKKEIDELIRKINRK